MNYSNLDILYLSPLMPDYLHDCVFLGLCELGCNVVEYPRKPSLHGVPYTELFRCDQLTFDHPVRELRKTKPDLIIMAAKMPHENQEMIERLALCRKELSDRSILCKKELSVPTIILDGLDWAHEEYPFDGYSCVFKRELYTETPKMKSLSFCAVPEPFTFTPFKNRCYDLSFIATSSHDHRMKVAEYLNSSAKEFGLNMFVHVDKHPIPRNEYLQILSQSKTSLSMRGAGLDCYRYWEIASKGTVLISENLDPLIIKNDFSRAHCFKFDYSEDMKGLGAILAILKNYPPEALQNMALNALHHTNDFHTPKKRAEHILQDTFKP